MPDAATRQVVLTFLTALLLGLVSTSLVQQAAVRFHVVAVPSEERWHRAPTPLLGGVAIVFAFVLTGLGLNLFAGDIRRLLWVSLGMFFLGLIDDLRKLTPATKLAGQLVLSSTLLFLGLRLSLTGIAPLDFLLSLLWLVGITNSFNLLDNVNGLCAGIATLVALFRAALFAFEGELVGALLCLALAGAAIGFLHFNFPAASIFMGDSGSLFLGFWLGGITLTASHPYTKNYALLLAIPVIIMLVPIFDTTLVTLTRRLSGRPISQGGRDHVSHRLVAYGFSDHHAVLAIWGVSFLSGSVALLMAIYGENRLLGIASVLVLSLILFGIYLSRYEHRTITNHLAEVRVLRWLSFHHSALALTALFDLILMVVSYHLAYLLKFEGLVSNEIQRIFVRSLPELMLIKFGIFVVFGVYRRVWKYFGLEDALALGWASVVASSTAVLYFSFVYRLAGLSRTIFVLDLFLFTSLVLAFRFSFRILDRAATTTSRLERVVIYADDDNGELALRLIRSRRQFVPVGFLGNDARRAKHWIHGVSVLGCVKDLNRLAEKHRIGAVVLASEMDSLTRAQLEEACRSQGLALLQVKLEIEQIRPSPAATVAGGL